LRRLRDALSRQLHPFRELVKRDSCGEGDAGEWAVTRRQNLEQTIIALGDVMV